MSCLPRLAVGSVQSQADHTFFTWGLLDVLARAGLGVQSFRARASFVPHDGARTITGRSQRHLDSWLMSAALCRELLSHGASEHDLALVEGSFSRSASAAQSANAGSNLSTLCDWLDLPRLGVLDVSQLHTGHLPQSVPELDGVFLDRVSHPDAAAYWQTTVETLWGVKVLGVLDEAAALRAEASRTPLGQPPAAALARAIGQRLEGSLNLDRLQGLADRPWNSHRSQLFSWHTCQEPLTVAIAYDDAFNCYFPDVLDLLELAGAQVRDFSPLKDPELPPDVDLVYFGCGHMERHAERLAANHCLKQALWRHVANGGRVYGEGGGAAYLCREMVLPGERRFSNVGLVPAVAQWQEEESVARPVEARLPQACWLGNPGTLVRGYRHPNWRFVPAREESSVAPAATDFFVTKQVVASGLHVNFAAFPRSFAQLLTPLHSAALAFSR